MKPRHASPLLSKEKTFSQRTSGTDDFIDLTGDECVDDAAEANDAVGLTGSSDCSDLPEPASRKAHDTGSERYPEKGKRNDFISSTGDENVSASKDESVSVGATPEVLDTIIDHQGNNLKIIDRIIFMLDRRTGYTGFMNYSMIGESARRYNASANIPSSHLEPPPHIVPPPGLTVHQAVLQNAMAGLPCYPDPNVEVPPLPTSLKGITTLTKARLVAVENYYGLSHEGNVVERRDRIKERYGVPKVIPPSKRSVK